MGSALGTVATGLALPVSEEAGIGDAEAEAEEDGEGENGEQEDII